MKRVRHNRHAPLLRPPRNLIRKKYIRSLALPVPLPIIIRLPAFEVQVVESNWGESVPETADVDDPGGVRRADGARADDLGVDERGEEEGPEVVCAEL